MKISIKPYNNSHKKHLIKCMDDLHAYLVPLDPYKKLWHPKTYGVDYTKFTLKKVKKYHGKIFMAFDKEKCVGCIVGIIRKRDELTKLVSRQTKDAEVIELYVDSAYRGKKIGALLMKNLEIYFKKQGCEFIHIEVFAPNVNAQKFYKKLRYENRMVNFMKKVCF